MIIYSQYLLSISISNYVIWYRHQKWVELYCNKGIYKYHHRYVYYCITITRQPDRSYHNPTPTPTPNPSTTTTSPIRYETRRDDTNCRWWTVTAIPCRAYSNEILEYRSRRRFCVFREEEHISTVLKKKHSRTVLSDPQIHHHTRPEVESKRTTYSNNKIERTNERTNNDR